MFMPGRQVSWMVYDHIKISDTDSTVLNKGTTTSNHQIPNGMKQTSRGEEEATLR